MAPKRNSKKGSSNGAASSSGQVQPNADNQQEPSAKKRRQLGRRATDEAIERQISQHFSDVPKSILETRTVDGLTIRARLYQDHQLRKRSGDKGRFGTRYWSDFHKMYNWEGNVLAHLKPSNPDDKVSDGLVTALQAAHDSNPSKRTVDPLLGFLQHTPKLNQRDRSCWCPF